MAVTLVSGSRWFTFACHPGRSAA